MIKDQRFLRYYEQELRFVRDLGGEFASEHARVADRFGLGADVCADPHVEWLMDGFAFLAARIQQKFDGDYALFTQHLLEMVYPDYLAPTPSMGIALLDLAPDAPPLERGHMLPRGTKLQSRIIPGEASRCVFTTAHPVTVWPIDIADARYLTSASLAAMGLAGAGRAGLLLRLKTRGGVPFASLSLDRLTLHLASQDRIAQLLYEALIGRFVGLAGRLLEKQGPQTVKLRGRVARVGFSDTEALLPPSPRGFSGFRLLREYFALPRRFLFVGLDGLQPLIRATSGSEAEIVVLFDRYEPALDGAVLREQFELAATPVINLFPRAAKPIRVEPFEDQHHVTVDRTRSLDHEVFAVTHVTGVGADGSEPRRFTPFYAATARRPALSSGYYTVERRPRLVSDRNTPSRSAYLGTEIWLELCNGAGGGPPAGLKRLDVDVLASNRDLPLRLPLPIGEAHFHVEEGGPVAGARVAGRLTPPIASPTTLEPKGGGPWGDVAWQLIGQLGLNYHSLVDGPGDRGADALGSLLELHAAGAEPQIARQAESVRAIRTRKVTGRLPGGGPITFGRGLEITVELADAAFQDGSAFLLGGVLETFFRRYVTLNSFIETIVHTSERGEIMRWPSQTGSRHLA